MASIVRASLVLLVLFGTARPSLAQELEYHGAFYPVPARGTLDEGAGMAELTSGKWIFTPRPESDGLAPDRELVQIYVGETDRLAVPVGAMQGSRNGKRFSYADPATTHGIRKLKLVQQRGGRWQVRVALVGIDLSALLTSPSTCKPVAVVVGNDDGFQGVLFVRPGGRDTSRVRVTGTCSVDDWPWL